MKKQQPYIMKTDDGNIRIHDIKVWTEYYDALEESNPEKRKTLEIRKYDRDYKVGDFLRLRDFNKDTQEFTGKETWRLITHMVIGQPFLPDDTVAMSILPKMPSVRF